MSAKTLQSAETLHCFNYSIYFVYILPIPFSHILICAIRKWETLHVKYRQYIVFPTGYRKEQKIWTLHSEPCPTYLPTGYGTFEYLSIRFLKGTSPRLLCQKQYNRNTLVNTKVKSIRVYYRIINMTVYCRNTRVNTTV